MMALIILIFIGLCVWWFLAAANRMFGFFKPKPVKFERKNFTPEVEKVPQVTNIQYNHTQVIIIEAPKPSPS